MNTWEVASYHGPRQWFYSHNGEGSHNKGEAMELGATEAELDDARSDYTARVTA